MLGGVSPHEGPCVSGMCFGRQTEGVVAENSQLHRLATTLKPVLMM